MSKEKSIGVVTALGDSGEKREINIINFISVAFKGGRVAQVCELENNEGYVLSVQNIPSSGRSSQSIWLSEESVIAIISASMIYFERKGRDMGEMLKKTSFEEIHIEFPKDGEKDNLT